MLYAHCARYGKRLTKHGERCKFVASDGGVRRARKSTPQSRQCTPSDTKQWRWSVADISRCPAHLCVLAQRRGHINEETPGRPRSGSIDKLNTIPAQNYSISLTNEERSTGNDAVNSDASTEDRPKATWLTALTAPPRHRGGAGVPIDK